MKAAFERRKSGLITPTEPPIVPARSFGPLEIRDEGKREKAKQALHILWSAMGCDNWRFPTGPDPKAMKRLLRFFGETILGDENPEHEEKC